ncbi:unnamed protein product [Brassica oleracea]
MLHVRPNTQEGPLAQTKFVDHQSSSISKTEKWLHNQTIKDKQLKYVLSSMPLHRHQVTICSSTYALR